MKHPFIIYADLECLLEKMRTCHNNPEKPLTAKINMHTLYCPFNSTKNKIDCYKGKGCMGRFCKDLKEHVTGIINYEKKEMIPLTSKEKKSYEKQKVCYILQKII